MQISNVIFRDGKNKILSDSEVLALSPQIYETGAGFRLNEDGTIDVVFTIGWLNVDVNRTGPMSELPTTPLPESIDDPNMPQPQPVEWPSEEDNSK